MVYSQEEKFKYPNLAFIKPLSRSYFKMIELLYVSHFFQDFKQVHYFRSVHVAEGPGGFIQAFIDVTEQNRKKVKKIDAITLRSETYYVPGWKKANSFIKRYSDILNISYGYDNTGNINNYLNQDNFINSIDNKVHIFTADGGFDFSTDYTQQEKLIFQLLVSSFIVALQTLMLNGYCYINLFDTYSTSTKTLLALCGSCFKEFSIYKPAISRPCNSERYFIGKNLKNNTKKVLDILKIFQIQLQDNKYPVMTIDSLTEKYIDDISSILEKKQIEHINLAKQFAENPELHKEYYKTHLEKSVLFCKDMKIVIKK
jgi:23S rRNA U2552 (ribose-2'-O)-methylase RlmE/FtsJ